MVLKIFAVIVLDFPASSSAKLRESSINATAGKNDNISFGAYSTLPPFFKIKDTLNSLLSIPNFFLMAFIHMGSNISLVVTSSNISGEIPLL